MQEKTISREGEIPKTLPKISAPLELTLIKMKTKLETFLARKGQIVRLDVSRELKTRAAFKGVDLRKVTCNLKLRAGVDYDNMKSVIEGRANGTKPAESQGLPWGEWKIFPHVITHKGSDYLRFSRLDGLNQAETRFYLDGAEITKEQAKEMALASEFREGADAMPDVLTYKAENVLDIR